MPGTNIGNKDQKRAIRDACTYGGLQESEKLFFRDTGIFVHSSADGVLQITSDATMQFTATTGIKLNAPSVKVYDAVITVGAFGATEADSMQVSVQLTQGDGATAVAEAIMFDLFLSTDAAGQTLDAAPSAGFAVGTDGTILIEHTANVYATCLTEADGDFDIILKDTASATTYVQVVLPSGLKVASTIVKFT